MSTATKTKPTWADILALPESQTTPKNATMTTFTGWLEGGWKPVGGVWGLMRALGDLRATRRALGMSQSELARALSAYLGKPLSVSAIKVYEWYERTRPAGMRWKYAPSKRVSEAYQRIVLDAIVQASDGRMYARKIRGAWQLRARCSKCTREFKPRNGKHKKCARCA